MITMHNELLYSQSEKGIDSINLLLFPLPKQIFQLYHHSTCKTTRINWGQQSITFFPICRSWARNQAQNRTLYVGTTSKQAKQFAYYCTNDYVLHFSSRFALKLILELPLHPCAKPNKCSGMWYLMQDHPIDNIHSMLVITITNKLPMPVRLY